MAPKRNNKDSDSDAEDAGSDVEVSGRALLCCGTRISRAELPPLSSQMLDVSFDFFDPQAHDYHSIKLLLSQLLSHDASLLDLGAVTDLVLAQKLVGSTVKTDGAEGDPYAVLTVLNLNVHKVSLDTIRPELRRHGCRDSRSRWRLSS